MLKTQPVPLLDERRNRLTTTSQQTQRSSSSAFAGPLPDWHNGTA